ncbi:hypothetical protein ACFW5I_27700 [Streptomyces sp. NPDC058818]|uniref:hypothetical protein n=1 Tax=Streptomyces sp. NPDC058818 TaxID=3346640 RepID=UPI0036955643
MELVSRARIAEWLKPLAPEPEIYLRTFWNWDQTKPAKDEDGRWCYLWRNPRFSDGW